MAFYRDAQGNLVDDQAPKKPGIGATLGTADQGSWWAPAPAQENQMMAQQGGGRTDTRPASQPPGVTAGITAGDGFIFHGVDDLPDDTTDRQGAVGPGAARTDAGRPQYPGALDYGTPMGGDYLQAAAPPIGWQSQPAGYGSTAPSTDPGSRDRSSQVASYAQQDSLRSALAPPPPSSSGPMGGNYLQAAPPAASGSTQNQQAVQPLTAASSWNRPQASTSSSSVTSSPVRQQQPGSPWSQPGSQQQNRPQPYQPNASMSNPRGSWGSPASSVPKPRGYQDNAKVGGQQKAAW